MVWPNKVEKGSVTDQLNATVDIFPTLLSIAGLNQNDSIDGRSFLPTLLGNPVMEERELYFVRREGGMKYGGKAYHAIRVGNWKLLQNTPYEPLELYNLEQDPFEKKNLIEVYPEKAKELNQKMMIHIQKGGQIPWQKKVEH